MIPKHYILILFFVVSLPIWSQHTITIDASLDDSSRTLDVKQHVLFENTTGTSLDTLYFHNWANSFSTKKSPLGVRLEDNYVSAFHFEKDTKRGNTTLKTVLDDTGNTLEWNRGSEVDLLYVILPKPLRNGTSVGINFRYTVKVAQDTYTRYGVDKDGNYKLRYWYVSPAVYDQKWRLYSNKNSNDLYQRATRFNITLHLPQEFQVNTELDIIDSTISKGIKTLTLSGDQRIKATLFLGKTNFFETFIISNLEVQSNLSKSNITSSMRAITLDRMVFFLKQKVGSYPFKKIIVSDEDTKNNPVYGLNQLPRFLSPFPTGFEYDITQFKTLSRTYLENTLLLDPRKDVWLFGALQIYLMIEYVNTYYPKMKVLGSLSDFWIIRWAHIADLEFNDQYSLLYLNMARNNIHQPLSTPKDSLTKFNKKIANNYYAGKGLEYLKDFLGTDVLDTSIKRYYNMYKLKPSTPLDFKHSIETLSSKNIDWFFNNYVQKRSTIDFKIKKTTKRADSIDVTIINKRDNILPVSITGNSKDGALLFKKWSTPIDSIGIVTVPSKGLKRLELNKQGYITEYNRANNIKTFGSVFNRPLQLRLFKDVQDHRFNQIFFMPVFKYNLYDGLTTGLKLYNKTILPKGVHYKLEPQYGFTSKTLIGSASVQYTNQFEQGKLRSIRYGFSGNYFSYDTGLFYKRFTPFMTFAFSNQDIRNNEKQFISLRNVTVSRDAKSK